MRALVMVVLLLAGCSTQDRPAPIVAPVGAPAGTRTWSFDADAEGGPPAGFSFARTGPGSRGRWVVRSGGDGASPGRVLVQEDNDETTMRFPLAIVEGAEPVDLRLSVRCRTVSGVVDQAAGLVFRYRDENNYYMARANALEGNVRLYSVKDGTRHNLASWDGPVAPGAWHEMRVEARGDALLVHWDGVPVIDTRDGTFPGAGRVGLWTKADSVTQFDDLALEIL